MTELSQILTEHLVILTEYQWVLTEHYWLCFDRTTFLTEHFGKLGFDRTVNGKMFCQKDALLGGFCHKGTQVFQ